MKYGAKIQFENRFRTISKAFCFWHACDMEQSLKFDVNDGGEAERGSH